MPLMEAVRALHLAALCVLAGGFAFPLLVLPRPGFAEPARAAQGPRLARMRQWGLAAALLSWLAWLALVGAGMSGRPVLQALDPSLLDAVLRQTRFGHLWALRLALMLLLARYVAWPRRTRLARSAQLDPVGVLLLLAVLVSQAWAGHATAAGAWQIAADVLHLLAAGLWLGTLPPLFALLRDAGRGAPWTALAAAATRRFSRIGLLAVAVLALTGFVNAAFLVGSPQAIGQTPYGRLVAAKVILFAAMVAIAAVNRLRWTPRLEAAASAAAAARGLWRNVAAEMAIGGAILAIVGVLGGSQPPAHAQAMPMAQAMARR